MKPIGGLVRYGEPSGDHAAADSADVRGHRLRLTATQAPTKGAKAADLIAEDYGLFFGSAGHAALYDYPTARRRQAVAENVWERGGIVAAVCHGPVLLPGVVDSGTGKSIIEGKTVTGFTIEGEVVLEVWGKLTSDGVAPVVEAVTKTGADYSSPMHPFDDYSITAGRVITGANPASARSGAERALKAFDELATAQARDGQSVAVET